MAPQASSLKWRAICSSVTGASHDLSGRDNQDAIKAVNGEPVLLCLSDGHGSERYIRSQRGAELAVEVGIKTFKEVAQEGGAAGISRIVRQSLRGRDLASILVKAWRHEVENDLQREPIEEDRLLANLGERDRQKILDDPVLAYGATFLGAMVVDDHLLLMQIGDGDILKVADDGRVEPVFEHGEQMIGNVTPSLCMPNAANDFVSQFSPLQEPPALLLLATDGYSNSFTSPAAFLQAGRDFLDLLLENRAEEVEENLGSWLKQTSARGSGDDISLGLLYRVEIEGRGKRPRREAEPDWSTRETERLPPKTLPMDATSQPLHPETSNQIETQPLVARPTAGPNLDGPFNPREE